jgi:type I restriction enzyme, S subunit
MELWKSGELGQFVEFINGGAWSASEYVEDGIPIVRVSDIRDGTIHLENCKYLPEESLEKYKKHILSKGDLIVTTVGSHPTQPGSVVGRAAIVPKHAHGTVLNQNAVRIVTSNPSLDQSFLGYLGKSQIFHDFIVSRARGAANQVRMAISELSKMPVCIPPLPTQRKIASILSAYDDLIENNTRRIRILEEMSQAIYQEWFVKLRFPGHQHVRMVESEMGLIPEGWEVVNLGALVDFKKGKKPKNIFDEPGDNRHPLFLIEGLRENPKQFTNDKAVVYVDEEDIIMVMDGASSGKVFIGKRGAIGSTLGVYRPYNKKVLSPYYLFLFLSTNFLLVSDNNIGSAIPHANKNFIRNLLIIIPPNNIAESFNKVVPSLFKQLQHYHLTNIILHKTRDLLLPTLVGGKTKVT